MRLDIEVKGELNTRRNRVLNGTSTALVAELQAELGPPEGGIARTPAPGPVRFGPRVPAGLSGRICTHPVRQLASPARTG